MDQKKLPNLLSIDDLLSSLEQNNEQENIVDDFDKVVTEFVLRYNLKPGNDFLSGTILYSLFNITNKEQIKKRMLNYYLAIHLPKYKNGFLIDLTTSKISKDIIRKLSKKAKGKNRFLDFQEFMDVYSIKQGKKKIEVDVLYLLYKDWVKTNNKAKLSKDNFLAFFRDRLKLFVTKDNRKYFKLTKTLTELAGRELALEIERQASSEDQEKKQQEATTSSTEETKKEAAIQESQDQVPILETRTESKD